MLDEMELRWVIRRRKVTAAQVVEYRKQHSVSIMQAKRILVNERGPVLQFRSHIDGQWLDVPTEVIEE